MPVDQLPAGTWTDLPLPPKEASAPGAVQPRAPVPMKLPPSWTYSTVRRPRLDFWFAVVVSLALHGWFIFGDYFWPPSRPAVHPVVEKESIIQLVMPPLDEPEKPEPEVDAHDEPAPGLPAPPTLADLPTVVPIDAFVQPLRPPAVSTTLGKGLSVIPIGPPGNGAGHGNGIIFEIGALDQQPRPRMKPDPAYPPEMRRVGATGEVEVEFIIDSHGRVHSVSVVRSSHPAFEAPVLATVQNWTFRPGRKGGRDVDTRVRQLVTFNPASP